MFFFQAEGRTFKSSDSFFQNILSFTLLLPLLQGPPDSDRTSPKSQVKYLCVRISLLVAGCESHWPQCMSWETFDPLCLTWKYYDFGPCY